MKTKTKNPQKNLVTMAPPPIGPIGSRSSVEKHTIIKDSVKWPGRIPGIPRWMFEGDLILCAELPKPELIAFIKNGKLKAYTKDGLIDYYSPDAHVSLQYLQFSFVDLFELEDQGLLYLGDSLDIQHYRKVYQTAKGKTDKEQPLKEEIESSGPKEKKLRQNQKAKIECRKVAEKLWKKDPIITITDMTKEPEILAVDQRKDGKHYMEGTIRDWIKDLCPDRSQGRRPNR